MQDSNGPILDGAKYLPDNDPNVDTIKDFIEKTGVSPAGDNAGEILTNFFEELNPLRGAGGIPGDGSQNIDGPVSKSDFEWLQRNLGHVAPGVSQEELVEFGKAAVDLRADGHLNIDGLPIMAENEAEIEQPGGPETPDSIQPPSMRPLSM